MTLRPPRVGLSNRDRIVGLVALGLDRAAHLWFLTDGPPSLRPGQELLARTAEADEFGGRRDAMADAAALPRDEVHYYRNPLDRLRKTHRITSEMVTGFNYVPPWA